MGDHGVSKRCVAFRGLVRSGETSNSRLLELPLRPAAIFWGDSVVIILGDAETGWTLFRRSPRLFWCLADRFGASSCSEEKVPPASAAGGVSGIPGRGSSLLTCGSGALGRPRCHVGPWPAGRR